MCRCSKNCGCSCWGCLLVAVFDVLLSAGTLVLWALALYEFKSARYIMERNAIKEDVAWYVIISLPIVALIGLWNGVKLFNNLRTDDFKQSGHIFKAVFFFIGEGVGFAAPFYIFDDYMQKITFLSVHNEFIVFKLMEINPVTICLFVYQILSFILVALHKRNVVANEEIRRSKPRPVKRKPPVETLLAESPTFPSAHTNNETSITCNSISRNGNEDYSLSSALLPSSGASRIPMYPDLNDIRVDMRTLLSNYVINIPEQGSSYIQRFGVDPTGTTTLRLSHSRSESSYRSIRSICVRSGSLYEDQEFPATNASLGSGRRVEWKRPHEIIQTAQFITDGVSRFDVRQGELGDCWFLAAMANLTLNEQLFKKVVPEDNEWVDSAGYAGICHFWFHVEGKWKEVVIDDRLPTKNGELMYLRSTDKNEFWSALLEKAYAKLNGSYANLNGNDGIGRAMVNLTGGKVSRYMLLEYRNKINELYELMEKSLANGKMVGCASSRGMGGPGIPDGHAYSITHISKLTGSSKPTSIIRIRNPWGNEKEWKGEFGDSHPAWNLVDKKTRQKLELIFQNDGEFWFPLKKLAQHFVMVEICSI